MHSKFGLNQQDFVTMIEEEKFSELAQKLKESLEKQKIRAGDYEAALDWLKKTAQQKGKTF